MNGKIPPNRLNHFQLLTIDETSQLLRLSPATLAAMRVKGGGPVFTRVSGREIRYSYADLTAWLESQRFTNTSGGKPSDDMSGEADDA